MTPWLRATVLAILVGASAAVLPQAGRAYGAEPPPLSAGAPDRRAADPVPLHGPPRGAASTPASATRSPGSVPAHETPPQATRPYATGLPPHADPGRPASPSTPSKPVTTRRPRHPVSPSAVSPGPPRGHGPERASPSASLAPSPSAATPSRAGSRAGEGRERPGRREDPAAEDQDVDGTDSGGTGSGDGDLTAVSEPPPQSAVARPSRAAERPVAGSKVFILPLGTGLVLVGLGLGLGLFALRVRRG
ncbi:hypothetical protein [Streptomyces sp. NPDC005303]|uniref:hypothetical protein n=1 Tax=Streptomyces sp. NPDC005303 TaxID=3155713 RepID=UPI0033AF169B